MTINKTLKIVPSSILLLLELLCRMIAIISLDRCTRALKIRIPHEYSFQYGNNEMSAFCSISLASSGNKQ
jgi:hypothetical protein